MRARVAQLLTTDCRRLWISTFHAFCARMLRREGTAIGLSRDFVIYDAADQLAVVRRVLPGTSTSTTRCCRHARRCRSSARRRNQMVDPETLRGESWSARGEMAANVYERYRRALHAANALDFDDPVAAHRGALRDRRAGQATLQRTVPVHHGRRVSGHEPAAVSAHPPSGRLPPQPVCRGRSRPVHLQVARRRLTQHHGLRAGFPRGDRRSPRAELPVDAGDSRRGLRSHPAEPQPQGEAALDRPDRRGTDPLLPRRGRARGGGLRDGAASRGARGGGRAHRGAVSHQRAVARPRGRIDPRGARLQDHRQRPVLRAEGDQGRARLPAAADEP